MRARLFKNRRTTHSTKPDPLRYLIDAPGLWNLNPEQRKNLTISCRDTDYIPKVKNAGSSIKRGKDTLQVMHNGLVVEKGGYFGDWMAEIITSLKGHHEPQEEKVFYEVLNRVNPDSWMIELGSFWAYYSIWFNKQIKGANNLCCEPDPENIKVGKRNAKHNNVNLNFINSLAGSKDKKIVRFEPESMPGATIKVPIRTVDSLVEEYSIKNLELLHLDVQGSELEALVGSDQSIRSKKVRFIFVSTHHYAISNNPDIHNTCLEFIKERGGHIISSHTIQESFSGDGLIVASFSKEDRDFIVPTSLNHTDNSLFRRYEKDISLLVDYYKNGHDE
jgi:FkbM family methyltransferase